MLSNMPPPVREITPEHWEDLITAFQRFGHRPMQIAKRTGHLYSNMEAFWEHGIPGTFPPIKETVAERGRQKLGHVPLARVSVVPSAANVGSSAHAPTPAATVTIHDHTIPYTTPHAVEPSQSSAPPPSQPPVAPAPPTALQSNDPATIDADVTQALTDIRRDLAKALRREAIMVTATREHAIGAASISGVLLRAAEKRAQQLARHLIKLADDGEVRSVARALQQLNSVMHMVQRSQALAKGAMELERLLVGLPQSISATVTPGGPSTTPEGLADTIAQLEKMRDLQKRSSSIIDVEETTPQYQGEEGGENE